MSRALADTLRARSYQSTSSRRRCAYSFTMAPQPAELIAMKSAPLFSKAAMLVRASARAALRSPACACNAPHHDCLPDGQILKPLACNTRAVAAFVCANNPRMTQPSSRATRSRLPGGTPEVRAVWWTAVA